MPPTERVDVDRQRPETTPKPRSNRPLDRPRHHRPFRRLTDVYQAPETLNLHTSYGYDELGNRISQTDANQHTTKYSYDQLGRRASRTLPMGQSESYVYDNNGNLQSKTDFNGHTTTYAYDTMNRLQSKTADAFFSQGACANGACGATQVSFTYTATGKRKTMTDASGTTTYNYDSRDRLQSRQTPFGTLTYSYDAANNLLGISSSNLNGANVTYAYDKLNRLSTVTDNAAQLAGAQSVVTTYGYDPSGNLKSVAYPNNVTTSYNYDLLNRLTQVAATTPGTTIASYQYALGPAGNRTAVKELSGRTVQFGYDDIYRLKSETIAGAASQNGAISYTYDAVGNRQQITSSVPAIPSSGLLYYDANDRTATDSYDNNGNTNASGGIQNVYDFENRLVQRGAVSVVYDGDGNRVSEIAGGISTNYLVDTLNPTGYAQVVDEVQTSVVARSYAYGLQLIDEGQLIAGSWQLNFYGHDGHGSIRYLTNAQGAVTDIYDYDAFGNLIASTGSTPNNYLFAGEQWDPSLNLYYNRARYLDVRAGRFLGMDSYEGEDSDPPSLHKYVYVGDDPVDQNDPCGHCLPSNTEIGKLIQLEIFDEYRQYTDNEGLFDTPISELVAPFPTGYGGALRPDLANPITGEFYEIKSVYSFGAAVSKVATYGYFLNKYDKKKGRIWFPGITFIPPSPIAINTTTVALVQVDAPGVITYCIIDQVELLLLSGIALASALYLAADLLAEVPETAYGF